MSISTPHVHLHAAADQVELSEGVANFVLIHLLTGWVVEHGAHHSIKYTSPLRTEPEQ